jgi:serine/threonine protein kinase
MGPKPWLSELGCASSQCFNLGSGTFGRVFATLSKEGLPIAVKETEAQSFADVEDEIKCNERIKASGCHINVLHISRYFFDSAHKKAHYSLQPALMDLRKLQHTHCYTLPQLLSLSLASDMSSGLAFLHKLEIIHRDIKPANMLIYLGLGRSGLLWKISDFGRSRLVSVRACDTVGFCTPYYRAPEVIDVVRVTTAAAAASSTATPRKSAERYSTPCDIWSLGCVLSELVFGRILFMGSNGRDVDLLATMVAVVGLPPPTVTIEGWEPEVLRKMSPATCLISIYCVCFSLSLK